MVVEERAKVEASWRERNKERNKYALYALAVLAPNILDCATTHPGLTPGASEGNPVQRWVIENCGIAGLWTSKLALGIGYVSIINHRHGEV